MPSACCCSGHPHHLTVWGQEHPSSLFQFPQVGQFQEWAPFVSEPRGSSSSVPKPGGALFRKRGHWVEGVCMCRVGSLCPLYRGRCGGHSRSRKYQGPDQNQKQKPQPLPPALWFSGPCLGQTHLPHMRRGLVFSQSPEEKKWSQRTMCGQGQGTLRASVGTGKQHSV